MFIVKYLCKHVGWRSIKWRSPVLLLSSYIKNIVEEISAVHFTKAKQDVKLKDF